MLSWLMFTGTCPKSSGMWRKVLRQIRGRDGDAAGRLAGRRAQALPGLGI